MTSHFWQGTSILCFTALTAVFCQNIFAKSLEKGEGKVSRNTKQLFIGLSFSSEVLVPLRTYFSLSFRTSFQHPTQNVLQGLFYVR